jgi:hypothetical protein
MDKKQAENPLACAVRMFGLTKLEGPRNWKLDRPDEQIGCLPNDWTDKTIR